MSAHPYRLVDAHNQGWLRTGNDPAGDGGTYRADYDFQRGLPKMTLAALTAERGPWRPVEPITDADTALLTDAFRRAGRKTVTSICAALEVVFDEVRESKGGLVRAHESYEYATRTMTAGREGSWESEVLKNLILVGNGFNLAPNRRGADNSIAGRRAAGPSKRVDPTARRVLADMLRRWISDPARYTEVAETLAWAVSHFADEAHGAGGAGGWKAVADQWLQPDSLAREDFVTCYRLLYSLSEHFDPNVI